MAPKRTSDILGFTLMELIVVIVLVGIVATVSVRFIELPVRGYIDLARRTELVDSAEQALRMIQREIREALPNSIRITPRGDGPGTVIEFIHVKAVGRYRDRPGGPGLGNALCRLQFSLADTSFDVVHDFEPSPFSAGDRLVISNWTSTGAAANAYVGDNITPTTTTLTLNANDAACGNEDRISLSTGFQFPFASANKRFFVVDFPIAYICDTTAGTLTRYAGHALLPNQASVDTDGELLGAGAASALVTDHVTGCTMTYNPGSPQRGGLVILGLTLSDGGEQISLLHQVHVVNAP